jgi:NADH-quinone oxidoreductase subunit G/NADP-reducing hydrogenase subunit HndD
MQIKIDGKRVKFEEGETILNVAKRKGINIPTLCYHPDLSPKGKCRLCLVEADGRLVTSCNTPAKEGMDILTRSKRALEARKLNGELLIANGKEENEMEVMKVLKEIGVKGNHFKTPRKVTCSGRLPIEKDDRKCVLCGRCVQVCSEIQGINNIGLMNRGVCAEATTPYNLPMLETPCTFCGQCALVCPTSALRERALSEKLVKAMDEMGNMIGNSKFYVAQTAPSIRVSLGEMFGVPPGTLVKGKMVSALKKMGFDAVFDTDFAADLTIMEEANEFVQRFSSGKNLPLITSCCPAWVVMAEERYPYLLKHISSCKSPQQMFGAVAKTYYAQKIGKPAKDIFLVSVMPCVAKKFEAQRPEMDSSGARDVDMVLTTRELGRLMKQKGIDLAKMEEGEFDRPLGISSGAGAIFGATGGVMEAALRVAYEVITGKRLKKIDLKEVRGFEGIREAEIDIEGTKVKVAVVHTLKNIREIVESGRWKKYHFIEFMACPGGCIGGGGQPRPTTNEIRKKRMDALYRLDYKMKLRISSDNPDIKAIYSEFLGKPLSPKAEKLLHTKYKKRAPKYF